MAKRKSSQKKKKAPSKKKVSSIPKAFHAVTPGLAVRDAAQAIEFYKRAFGAKEKGRMMRPDGKLAHGDIMIGDSHIMMGEEDIQMNNPSPLSLNGSPISLYVYVKDADKVFNQAVREGATVAMPMMDQFWGDRAGMVTDPYGHKWWLATHTKDLSPKEMKKAAEEFFASMGKQ